MAMDYMKLANQIQDPIRFPDDALQRMVKSPNPAMPMEQSLAMGEWMRRQKIKQSGAASKGPSDNRSVKDLVLNKMYDDQKMQEGVQNYPQPQMDMRPSAPQQPAAFKVGGLVSFATGGTARNSQPQEGTIDPLKAISDLNAAHSVYGWLTPKAAGGEQINTAPILKPSATPIATPETQTLATSLPLDSEQLANLGLDATSVGALDLGGDAALGYGGAELAGTAATAGEAAEAGEGLMAALETAAAFAKKGGHVKKGKIKRYAEGGIASTKQPEEWKRLTYTWDNDRNFSVIDTDGKSTKPVKASDKELQRIQKERPIKMAEGGYVPWLTNNAITGPNDPNIDSFPQFVGKNIVNAPGRPGLGMPSALLDRIKGMYTGNNQGEVDPGWAGMGPSGLPSSGAQVAQFTAANSPFGSTKPANLSSLTGGPAMTAAQAQPPAPRSAPSTPAGGIAAQPKVADFAKDLIGEKPEVKDLDKFYDEQATLWEKVLGKDGFADERDQNKKDRERADVTHENSKAYAMLAAAGAMTDVRTPGLAGFLQGLGRAASTAAPALMKGDEDYDKMIKEANRTSLEIKKGERAEALGKMAGAEKAYEAAQSRLEKFNERRMTVLTQLEMNKATNEAHLKAAGISAGAVGQGGMSGLFKASGYPQTPEGFDKFMAAYNAPKSDMAGEANAQKLWKDPLIRMKYNDNYDAFKRSLSGQSVVHNASSLGLD